MRACEIGAIQQYRGRHRRRYRRKDEEFPLLIPALLFGMLFLATDARVHRFGAVCPLLLPLPPPRNRVLGVRCTCPPVNSGCRQHDPEVLGAPCQGRNGRGGCGTRSRLCGDHDPRVARKVSRQFYVDSLERCLHCYTNVVFPSLSLRARYLGGIVVAFVFRSCMDGALLKLGDSCKDPASFRPDNAACGSCLCSLCTLSRPSLRWNQEDAVFVSKRRGRSR